MITAFKYLEDFLVEERLGVVYVTLVSRTRMKKFKSLRNSFPHCRIRTTLKCYWLPYEIVGFFLEIVIKMQ